jgi:hypothetical protein
MRVPLLLAAAVVLLVAGCGGPQRTVVTMPPDADIRPVSGGPVVAPVYPYPRPTVMAACLLACDSYFHDQPDAVDAEAGTLHVLDRNAWTGSIPLSISLVDVGDGSTRMDMEAGEADDYLGDETALQRKRMHGFVDAVALHLRTGELMRAKAQPAATGSDAGAASATSRP